MFGQAAQHDLAEELARLRALTEFQHQERRRGAVPETGGYPQSSQMDFPVASTSRGTPIYDKTPM